MLDKIKTAMLLAGERGEFFPISMSQYPYNDTDAQIDYPLALKQAEKLGASWALEPEIPDVQGLRPEDAPDDIKDVGDDILGKAIICEEIARPFRIIRPSWNFIEPKIFLYQRGIRIKD